MLADAPVSTRLPAEDLDRARRFFVARSRAHADSDRGPGLADRTPEADAARRAARLRRIHGAGPLPADPVRVVIGHPDRVARRNRTWRRGDGLPPGRRRPLARG